MASGNGSQEWGLEITLWVTQLVAMIRMRMEVTQLIMY